MDLRRDGVAQGPGAGEMAGRTPLAGDAGEAASRSRSRVGGAPAPAESRGLESLLVSIGSRVKALRADRRWSRRELAERTRLSERFLAQVEMGEGNPSVASLAQIAGAFDTTAAALLTAQPRKPVVALLGLRGAGKSTIGRALAQRLGAPFIELDQKIEEAAGLSLREIFELHGEEYYRKLEREALETLLAEERSAVVAPGGGIVTHRENLELLRRVAMTIWLKATPDDHWNRVVAQGDHRPMANDPLAKTHLRELLARREELYRSADHTVDTSAAGVEEIVEKLAGLVPHEERVP